MSNSSSRSSSRKRRNTEMKEEPTKKRVEEGEKGMPDDDSLSCASDDYILSCLKWDDIGDREESYLSSTREELYELIKTKEAFSKKIMEKNSGKFEELYESLFTYGRENLEELQRLDRGQIECAADERSKRGRVISLVSFQHARTDWMVTELFRRLHVGRKVIAKKERLVKNLEEESGKLRKSLEEVTRERDELLGKTDSRRKEARDVGVSMEAEVPEVEMEMPESSPALSSFQGFPRDLVAAMEGVIEKKMGEFLSRVGLPLENERAGMVHKSAVPWSEVVKKSGGVSMSQRDPAPLKDGKRKKEVQASVAFATGEAPNTIGRPRRRKKKKREWPLPPKTAAVVLRRS